MKPNKLHSALACLALVAAAGLVACQTGSSSSGGRSGVTTTSSMRSPRTTILTDPPPRVARPDLGPRLGRDGRPGRGILGIHGG